MFTNRRATAVLALALALTTGTAAADPARLGNTPLPVVEVKGKSTQDVMDAIRLVQGSSSWQQPKGWQTFTLAQMGPDVRVSAKVDTEATSMFDANDAVVLMSNTAYNEQHLQLQLIAAIAEGRLDQGDHNTLGIVKYKKPTRETKTVGIVIDSLVPGGPAERAGLKSGDMITAIGGMPTAEQSDMALSFMGLLLEGTAKLTVEGKGDVLVIKSPRPGAPLAEAVASPQPVIPSPTTAPAEVFASPQPIIPPPATKDR